MEWLLPALFITFCNSFILFLVYLYLFNKERNQSLKLFTICWFVYSIRFIFMILYTLYNIPFMLLINQLTVWISSLFLLAAFYSWINIKKYPVIWKVLAVVIFVWIIVIHFLKLKIIILSLPTFVATGIIYIYCGYLLAKDTSTEGIGKKIIIITFVIWGLHKMDYPFLVTVKWFAPIGYFIGAVSSIITAIGIVLIYFEKTKNEVLINKMKLEENKNFYEHIIESIEDGIWVTDKNDMITYTNNGMTHIAGISKEQIIGKNVLKDFPKETIVEFQTFFNKAKTNLQITPYKCFVHTPGKKHSYQTGILIPLQENDSYQGMICTIHDYTDKKMYEAELQQSIHEKNILLREINHRVKNNLTVVLSLIQYQAAESNNPEIQDILIKLQNRINTIALIHSQLHKSNDIYIIDFKTYLIDLTDFIINSLGESRDILTFNFNLKDNQLNIDQTKTLGLIINECITNSIKYAFKDGRKKHIEISLNEIQNDYELNIKDNGPGFPGKPENIKNTGLFLIEQLCEEIKGELTITSDEGAIVSITFPKE